MQNVKPYWQNYVDGQWIDGGAGRLDIVNPATGQKLAEQALADAADVDRAVQAARRVHLSGALSDLRPVERGRMVQSMGRFLLDHIEEIAVHLTLEQGKPLWEARKEVQGAARYFEYYGNQAETVEGRSIPLGANYFDFTTHEPYGVSAQIIPWNYPVEMTARSLSAGLATGNTCVVKTPELTRVLKAAFEAPQPPMKQGRVAKLRYAHSGGKLPPRIVMHGSRTETIPEAYRRFLVNRIIKHFKLRGTPVVIEFRNSENPYKDRKNVLTRRQLEKRKRLKKFTGRKSRK